MYKIEWCTCKVVVLLIKPIVFWRSRYRLRRWILKSLATLYADIEKDMIRFSCSLRITDMFRLYPSIRGRYFAFLGTLRSDNGDVHLDVAENYPSHPFTLFSLHTWLAHHGVWAISFGFRRALRLQGRYDALRSLCLNSRVLPRSLSFCPRSGEGSFCHPTLLPWCRSTRLRLTPAAYLSCHSCRGLLP